MFDEAELRRCAEADDLREALRLCQEENARLRKEKSTQTIMAEIAMKIYETLERVEDSGRDHQG